MAEINITGTTNLDVQPESEQISVGNFNGDPLVGEMAPSTDSYDNISIPGELLGEQSQPGNDTEPAETTESTETAQQTESTNIPDKESSADKPEQTDAVSKSIYEMADGSKVTEEEILTWKKDADNRHDWNKSNTEKAQEVADQRRAIEPFIQLVEKFKTSEDFAETLKEAVEDELGEEAGQLFEQSLKMDNKDLPNPYESELTEAKEQLEQIKSQQALDQSLTDLKSTYKINESKAQEVLDYAIKTHEETGRLLTLDEAYKVMNFDKAVAEPKTVKSKPSVPVNVQKTVGVKSDKQSKIKDYEDIDVASFFN